VIHIYLCPIHSGSIGTYSSIDSSQCRVVSGHGLFSHFGVRFKLFVLFLGNYSQRGKASIAFCLATCISRLRPVPCEVRLCQSDLSEITFELCLLV